MSEQPLVDGAWIDEHIARDVRSVRVTHDNVPLVSMHDAKAVAVLIRDIYEQRIADMKLAKP